jgi:hypothetical protein
LSVEKYLQELVSTIDACPYVESSGVSLDSRGPDVGLLRGEARFLDGSRLFFRELLDFESDAVRVMYSYHYQRSDSSLVFRYDDTPHHPGLPHFPHHKHQLKELFFPDKSEHDAYVEIRKIIQRSQDVRAANEASGERGND